MKTTERVFKYFLILSLALAILACSKEDSTGGEGPDGTEEELPPPTSFTEAIARGDDFGSYPQSRTLDLKSESPPKNEDYDEEDENGDPIEKRFICTRKTYSVLDGNGKFPLFDTASEVIYPGSLLQGKSLSNATPSPIVVKRARGTISYNLNNGNLNSSFTTEGPVTKSSIQTGMNTIIANSGEVVPANFQLDIIQIESENQLAVELGIDVETWTTKVSADMSFSSEKSFNRTLVKLNQSYYTMSFDLPTSLDEIFDESVTPEDLAVYVQKDNPATFVSSVTYGRIFYMLIESTSSRQEMSSKLNIAYGAFNNKAEGELGVNAMQELKDLKIKVIAYGGDAEGTFKLAGETNISDIADKLAESTDVRAGLPLSYVVRSVKRPDQIVGTRIATEYDVVECELKGVLPPGLYNDLVDLFEDGIGAMAHLSASDVIVFNKAGDKYAWFNGNTPGILSDGDRRIFSIDDPEAPLGTLELDNVGAAIQFADNLANRLYIFSGDGFKVQILRIGNYPANMLPTSPIGTAGAVQLVNEIFGDSGNFFLASQGIGAGVRIGATAMAYFGQSGDDYQTYNSDAGGSWSGTVFPSNNWYLGQTHDGPDLFEKVGAATYFTIGGSSGRYLFVNEDGSEIQEWFSFDPQNDRFEGPWVIN
ncbi:MAG: thiol-activated cytolysin family protein [Flavobacteriaceae bacterium]